MSEMSQFKIEPVTTSDNIARINKAIYCKDFPWDFIFAEKIGFPYHFMLGGFKDFDWNLVKNNPHYNWNWSALSRREDLDWNFVIKNPNLPWNWRALSCRRDNVSTVVKYRYLPWDWKLVRAGLSNIDKCRLRTNIIKEELLAAAYHPKRVEKWLEAGGIELVETMFKVK